MKPCSLFEGTPEEIRKKISKVVESYPQGMTLLEISEVLGISPERIRQIKNKAERKFRKAFLEIKQKDLNKLLKEEKEEESFDLLDMRDRRFTK